MIRVTKTTLKKANACPREVARFAKLFPRGAELTAANLRKAAAGGLPMWWLSNRLRLLGGTPGQEVEVQNILRPLRHVVYRGIENTPRRRRRGHRDDELLLVLGIIAVLDLR